MTTDRPWADLPNARHIDAVLADVKARPEVWHLAYRAAAAEIAKQTDEQTSVWERMHIARQAAQRVSLRGEYIKGQQQYMKQEAGIMSSWVPASDAMDALIAWDDSAALLDLPVDTLRTMIDLAPEPVCHQAALLLTRALVMESN